jgi:hypothetical protein
MKCAINLNIIRRSKQVTVYYRGTTVPKQQNVASISKTEFVYVDSKDKYVKQPSNYETR